MQDEEETTEEPTAPADEPEAEQPDVPADPKPVPEAPVAEAQGDGDPEPVEPFNQPSFAEHQAAKQAALRAQRDAIHKLLLFWLNPAALRAQRNG